jgi:uncharacterized protein (TIGR02302 family)
MKTRVSQLRNSPDPESRRQRPARTKKPLPRLGGRRLLARLALLWERIWPRFWPAISIAGLFLALALFDILPDLDGWLHSTVLGLFAVAFLAALWWGAKGVRVPSDDDARRRLETASGLEHRPLTTLEDDMAIGRNDDAAEALWQAHRERARQALKAMRVGPPRPPVARRDPWALRGAVAVILAVAAVTAWDDAPARLERALQPGFEQTVAQNDVTIEAWITPPSYTGRPPRMVDVKGLKKPLIVPRGTKLMIQVHGGAKKPVLTAGRQRVVFKALDKTSFQGEVALYHSGRVRVEHNGDRIVNWPVQVMRDLPPKISWAKSPKQQSISVRFDYKAEDDYRIKRIRAYIARNGETDVITIGLPVIGGRKAKGAAYHDLSSHRWAGLPVAVILEVEDDAGQTGVSKVRAMTLPQRGFSNPVARELVLQRRMLTMDPTRVHDVIRRLERLALQRKIFEKDPASYLGLRSAQGRLILGVQPRGQTDGDYRILRDRAIRQAQELMWSTALRIEEGGLSELERRLRRLQRELARLLSKKNPDPKELKKLMDKLREAMREYMRALREDMRKNPQKYSNRPFNPNNRTMTNKDIERLMQELRNRLARGDKEGAQRLLSQLRRLMEQLRAGNTRPMDPNHPALKMMRKFGDLIRRQQKLMDETQKRARERRQGKGNPKEDERLQKEQNDIRKQLGELMRRLGGMTGKVPKNLGRAEQEMRRAEGRLKGRQPGRATGPQARALEQLRRGARSAMRQMARRFGLRPGRGMRAGVPRQGQLGRDRDPLGRRLDGMGPLDDNDVKVPTESQRKRARDILEELRRRSGDGSRPKIELDYLDRLLRQF